MSEQGYVIVKYSRIYHGGYGYTGLTCDYVPGCIPGCLYESKEDAEEMVRRLNEHNVVGFRVEEYRPK